MANDNFKTPVLLLIFNRTETVLQVMRVLQIVQPAFLYIAADGPRPDKIEDKEKCAAARQAVLQQINWDCEIKTLFREQNVGCKYAVYSALKWFFINVEQGIILEDDILPSLSFFPFCEEMLNKYAHVENIKMVSGFNQLDQLIKSNCSYYFSSFVSIWGWATWRRAIDNFDLKIDIWKDESIPKIIKRKLPKEAYSVVSSYYEYVLDEKNTDVSSWDIPWQLHVLINNGLQIIPRWNLCKNIGVGENATHTTNMDPYIINIKVHELKFPLTHPKTIVPNRKFDMLLCKRDMWQPILGLRGILNRVIYKFFYFFYFR